MSSTNLIGGTNPVGSTNPIGSTNFIADIDSLGCTKPPGPDSSASLFSNFSDRDKRIALCLPGKTYDQCFLTSYTQLMVTALMRRWAMFPIFTYSSNVFHVRNNCLGKASVRGEPFEGVIPYTHILWIDSDQEFKVSDLDNLIATDLDIVGGWYVANKNNETTSHLIGSQSRIYGEFFKKQTGGPVEVGGTGFGFLLMKRGVFEKIPYPWFTMEFDEFGMPCSEDVSFCIKARRAGFKIYVHPFVHVGHNKNSILY